MEHLEKFIESHAAIDYICTKVYSQTNIPKAFVLMLPLLACPLYLLMTICSPIQVGIVLIVSVFLFFKYRPTANAVSTYSIHMSLRHSLLAVA